MLRQKRCRTPQRGTWKSRHASSKFTRNVSRNKAANTSPAKAKANSLMYALVPFSFLDPRDFQQQSVDDSHVPHFRPILHRSRGFALTPTLSGWLRSRRTTPTLSSGFRGSARGREPRRRSKVTWLKRSRAKKGGRPRPRRRENGSTRRLERKRRGSKERLPSGTVYKFR